MPTVPMLEPRQQTARALPDAQLQAPLSNDVQNAANAAGNAADVAGRIAYRQQVQRNADRVLQAETTLRRDYLAFEQEARQRTGQNAWGLTNDAAKWWRENSGKYLEGLENGEQRRAVQGTISDLQTRSIDSLGTHEANERRRSLDESGRASIVSSINLAASQHNDPAALQGAKRDITNRVQALSALNGWSPELKAANESQYLTDLHKQVLQSMVDTNPSGAQQYYAANKAEIAGTEHAQIEKALEIGGIRVRAQTAVDELMAMNLGRTATLAKAREKFAGAEEDEIIQRIGARFGEIDAVKAKAEKDTADAAWDVFARAGSVDAIPPSVMSRLDGRTLIALRSAERTQRTAESVKTDWNTYGELRDMARDNPKAFASLDLRKYRAEVSDQDLRTLYSLQNTAAKPDEAHEINTVARQLSTVHTQMGWGSKDKEKQGMFDSAALRELQTAQDQKGSALTAEERQKVIDRLLIEGEITRNWWPDKEVRLFEITDPSDAQRFEVSVPDADRHKIEAALNRRGIPVTDDAVRALYMQKNGL